MLLRRLLGQLELKDVRGNDGVRVTHLDYDSRKIGPGGLFIAIQGSSLDGHQFIGSAIERGAIGLVVQDLSLVPEDYPGLVAWVEDTRKALSRISATYYGDPSQKMLSVGITGTNGKTSTAWMCSKVLKELEFYPGMVGTIEAQLGGKTIPIQHTTPESLELQHILSSMEGYSHDSVVMEVSSHALAQSRCHDVEFDIAVFTNLTRDHLDYHGTVEEYYQSKRILFDLLAKKQRVKSFSPFAVINSDCPYGKRLCQEVQVPYITFGFEEGAHIRAVNVKAGSAGTEFDIVTPLGDYHVELPLAGFFHVQNALATIGVGVAMKLSPSLTIKALKSLSQIPGRFEHVDIGQPFSVVVDYAHTPDGLKNLMESVREVTSGSVHTVMGCGGDRDKGKRPMMGSIAESYSTTVIVTNDNPRGEDPEQIAQDIESGFSGKAQIERILDRRAAIERAIRLAKPGDTVVIAGKGHEKMQIIGTTKSFFSDSQVSKEVLEQLSDRGELESFLVNSSRVFVTKQVLGQTSVEVAG